ncbi:MAG: hypothetical protein V2I33_25680 [Kangiellaceae bacterium]|jgi:hypothetical protein|nr:hypothetical protein [Kangiellaceae bacterium]
MKTSLPQNSPFFSLFTDSLKPRKSSWITVLILFFTIVSNAQVNQNVTIDANSPSIIDNQTFGRTFIAGDTIFVSAERDRP